MRKLVFMGDSVTDCSRKRAQRYEHTEASYGDGWVYYVYKKLVANQGALQIWNRGYSGSLIHELPSQTDWWPSQKGQLVQADICNLMIGINDIWHPFWKGTQHTIAQALTEFRELLLVLKTRSDTVIVCEPIALPCGDVTQQWWPPLNALTKGQFEVCNELGVHWLALQDQLLKDAHGQYQDYLADGVHPTDLGHRWLSTQWLNFIMEQGLLTGNGQT